MNFQNISQKASANLYSLNKQLMKLQTPKQSSKKSSQTTNYTHNYNQKKSYVYRGQRSNPQKYPGQKTMFRGDEKILSRNLTSRNKTGSNTFMQSPASIFPSSSVKTINSHKMNAYMVQNPIDNKAGGFQLNRTHTTSSNYLYNSWVRPGSDQAPGLNKLSSQISQYQKQNSKNRTLQFSKSDIYDSAVVYQKQKQPDNKKIKKESIMRLENKVNQYLELIQNMKQRAAQDPKKIKKIACQNKLLNLTKQLSETKKYLKSPYKKQQLKTEVQTPVSSPVLSSYKPLQQETKESCINEKMGSQQFEKEFSLKDFIILKKIGQGRLGQIMAVLHKKTHTVYAIKKIKKQIIKQNKLEQQLCKQIKVQASFNHPNIVKIFGFFDDQDCVYLLMEYCEQGSLDDKMAKRNYHKKGVQLFTQAQTSICLKDVICGLQQMHEHQIMHRDIKPANIVLSHGVHKICDFGWATSNPDKNRRTTYCGTFDYAAPQIFKGQQYDLQVDLWQLGVMAYEIATGKLPFYKPSQKQSLRNVINYSNQLSFPKQSQLSQVLKQFILDLLQKNPQDRIPAKLLLRHPFIVSIGSSEQEQ